MLFETVIAIIYYQVFVLSEMQYRNNITNPMYIKMN